MDPVGRGRVTDLIEKHVAANAPLDAYICGAPVMVDSAQRDFVQRCGLPAEEFYADAFTSEADKHGPSAD